MILTAKKAVEEECPKWRVPGLLSLVKGRPWEAMNIPKKSEIGATDDFTLSVLPVCTLGLRRYMRTIAKR